MSIFGVIEEEPRAVAYFTLSHFPTVIPCNQQVEGGKGEGAAHILKFVKQQRQCPRTRKRARRTDFRKTRFSESVFPRRSARDAPAV